MKICVDKNHLLVIEHEDIPKVKKYTVNAGGYLFSDFDKGVLVRHKKQIKIVNLKNLGDGMAVFYVKSHRELPYGTLDMPSFVAGLCNYRAFDETMGKHYCFVPKFRDDALVHFNKMLVKLGVDARLEKTSKGVCVAGTVSPSADPDFVSQMFAFVLLYGKLDLKGDELVSFKFHLPLFGAYLAQRDSLDASIDALQAEGFFLKKDIVEGKDGIIYQVSCNDYELLQVFARLYEPIEKVSRIPKYEQCLEAKKALLEFVKNDSQIPQEGKIEVIKMIEKGIVKLLVK